MINRTCLLAVLFCFFLLQSCNSNKSDIKVENFNQNTKSDYTSGDWLEKLPNKTPLTQEELERLLPKSLNDMPLVNILDDSKKGRVGIKAVYSNGDNLSKEDIHINFFITDGAGEEGYKHLKSTFNMLKFPLDKEEGAKISKISEWKGKRLAIKQRLVKEKWVSIQEFISTLRYHLKLEGQNLKAAQLDESIAVVEQIRFPE
jgi:hypothetical protein